ncbi:DUF4434 domain-containing protein [Dysgonomonas sp. 25]|uniref:DUF4434 domain-containing protein n=1 Tax=Dysgonomonas sp. 25 TaxID=2302933 RepID=UPI0013CFDF39|nr:DUF4434 domain-containing protein [Dysgonomonas sp. 25]NDV69705.1 DUF4434 domain-containing protein [Dysgonomonas sp. 25]
MKKNNRRDFLKTMSIGAAAMASAPILNACNGTTSAATNSERPIFTSDAETKLIVPHAEGLPLSGAFLDEISHDIPHQNWGEKEWEQDFMYMKAIGIDTVIMIRSGYRKFITYPSEYLLKKGCYKPSVDLLDMFLRLADKHGMKFYFGLYDSGHYWDTGDMSHEVEDNRFVIDEVWEKYGQHHKSFQGWYISGEISRATKGAIDSFYKMGKQCKDVSNNLPTFISPWIDGKKAVMASSSQISRAESVSIQQHEKEWNEIFDGIKGAVDACAFQDGQIDYDELDAFFTINKQLADKHGLQCWTNAESFDRDMPIKFLPIKFDKLRMKLEAAKRAGYDKAITFEFSHFMSPQSAYIQAGHLYDRYREYFNIK